ncbi:MAG: hypothetical protein Q7K55_09210 [Candidatus Levybacteria bacterium]|nr:hypothetical protein [Candidatus Levybacteria bacterium]
MSNFKLPIIGYLIAIIVLFFYSFTQIDLGLTLSEVSVWQTAEKFFKNIGYFQRPFSSFLFVSIVLSLFTFYLLILNAIRKKEISRRAIWFLIITTTVILAFSYNAFSYDLFNYMFDAKIVTYYQQNPFVHKALDFPGDPMLSFMHSTHRPYPYGPFFLALTVPLSFLGFNFFLPTFFLFKIFTAFSFLGIVFFIEKILNKISPKNKEFGIVLFALNPLVLIEGLVSSHNDIIMMFFSVWSLHLLLEKKYIRSIILLIFSIGVKFATIFLVPILIYVLVRHIKKQEIDLSNVAKTALILMILAVAITSFASGINKNPEIQPWYFLILLPFAALVQKRIVTTITICISIGMLVSYVPFIATGQWPADIVELKIKLLTLSILGGITIYFLLSKRRRFPV